jgi:hypothetical protein
MVRVAEGMSPWVHQADIAKLKSICVKMVEIFVTFLGPPMKLTRMLPTLSISPDKLARLPTFFILEAHFLRDRIFGCSRGLLSFPKDLAILDIRSPPESVL